VAIKPGPPVVTLYTVPGCPLCENARHWLTQNRIIFAERDVANNFGAFRAMYKLTRQRLVPVFDVNGQALVRPSRKELEQLLLKV